jgi:hypothetical protein
MLSIVIPSRSPQYLQRTVDDLLSKAEDEVEVIVVLDGIWTTLVDDPRVTLVHHGEVHNNIGMRGSISLGMMLARGTHVMKVDEHTMVGQGYDRILKANCEDNWVVIPRRKRLDPETWTLIEDGRPPVDYMKLDYPYAKPLDKTQGLHGSEDRERGRERKDVMIDDVMTMQGSAYFMTKKYWDEMFPEGMDDENYGPFTQEAQEISNRVWLSGGRVVVNKNTFYAHFHKGKKGKGYGFTTEQYKKHAEQNERGRIYCIEYWLNTMDYKYSFEWLVEKFNPDGWPENWQEQVKIDREKDYSTTGYKDDYWLEGLRK